MNIKKIALSGLYIAGFVLAFFILLSSLFISSDSTGNQSTIAQVNAQECNSTAEVSIIARDQNGNFTPNIRYELYEQVDDVDGKPKPSTRVSTGIIDPILGRGTSTFVPRHGTYAIKLYDKNSTVGAHWFYNEIEVTCGETIERTFSLSGIQFILRNSQSELRPNHSFSLYTQTYDADNNPIKDELVTTQNTGSDGKLTIYVADKTRSIDGSANGLYVMETSGIHGGTFIEDNITVSQGKTTQSEYLFSDMAFTVKDADGTLFPANTTVEVYKQVKDYDGEPALGAKLKNVVTDDKGVAIFEYPEGTYAARFLAGDKQYRNFWNLVMVDQQRANIDLKTSDDFSPGQGACSIQSELIVVTKNALGDVIPNINYALFEQVLDANGKPSADNQLLTGKTGAQGRGTSLFNPDPRLKYILKLYESNADIGAFWFFDNLQYYCGEDKELSKTLSSIKVIFRDGDENLIKNRDFQLYAQKTDVDGNPVRERGTLVVSSKTTEEGYKRLYVASDHKYDSLQKGVYVLVAKNSISKEHTEFNIPVSYGEETIIEYKFSDILLELKTALGTPIAKTKIEVFTQEKNSKGEAVLSSKVATTVISDDNGFVKLEMPADTYALRIRDSVNQDIIFWDVEILNRQRANKTLTASIAHVKARDGDGNLLPEGTAINIFDVIFDTESGYYFKNKRILASSIGKTGYADIILAPGPYLFSMTFDGAEYISSGYIAPNKLLNITLESTEQLLIDNNTRFVIEAPRYTQPSQPAAPQTTLIDRVRGYILLQVEEHGEAWYVDHDTSRRYYMKDGPTAYEMLRKFGLGISNTDLDKIPIGLDNRFVQEDTDGDGLADRLEDALGSDPFDIDTDGDGYGDADEVSAGYSPVNPAAVRNIVDNSLTNRLLGKILLQVETHGEAWYLNPQDGRRYYMKNGEAAYNIMRFLSLGITNSDLNQISTGSL